MTLVQQVIYKYRLYGFKKFFYYLFIEIKLSIRGILLKSYSQDQEDIIIDRLLGNKKKGFYVDIGCNHPHRFSNTKRFYDKGRHGINIDADPNNVSLFNKTRTRDVNLNIGISDETGDMVFYNFNPSNISTFSKDRYVLNKEHGFSFLGETIIQTLSLEKFMEKYCSDGEVDFMSVDAEGFDYRVLLSNDWSRYRPRLICVESCEYEGENNENNNINNLLSRHDYEMVADTGTNQIYRNGLLSNL